MDKKYYILFALVLVLALGLAGYFYYKSQGAASDGNGTAITGGDRDEHGCIGSAGYVWCEAKNKCLREFEERCEEPSRSERAIIKLLAERYGKQENEVAVSISVGDSEHLAGSAKFAPDGAGGLFLAVKDGENWKLAYDGNGSPNCEELRSVHGFSDDILRPDFCN
jgi:hypothetical protein